MSAINSTVLACSHAVSGSAEASRRLILPAAPSSAPTSASYTKLNAIRAQQAHSIKPMEVGEGRREAIIGLAAAVFFSTAAAATSSSANAGIIEEYLEKSKANKELNDRKRLATSGANLARAYTVEFGTCKFPQNFTGCQDLAKQKELMTLLLKQQLPIQTKPKFLIND